MTIEVTSRPTHRNNFILRGLKEMGRFFYHTPLEVLAMVVMGVMLQIFFPVFAPPFFGMAGSVLLSRLFVKVLGRMKFMEKVILKACQLHRKFPKLRLIAFIFSVAICFLSKILGGIMGGLLGIYSGVIIEVELCKKQREKREQKVDEGIGSIVLR